jgi:hypothetical protein
MMKRGRDWRCGMLRAPLVEMLRGVVGCDVTMLILSMPSVTVLAQLQRYLLELQGWEEVEKRRDEKDALQIPLGRRGGLLSLTASTRVDLCVEVIKLVLIGASRKESGSLTVEILGSI